MAQAFTDADVNQISNAPGVLFIRPFGSSGAYTETVFTNDVTFNYAPEIFTQEFGSTGDVFDVISKETGTITLGIGKVYDADYLATLSAGLFTKETVAGGATVCSNQVIAANWVDGDPIALVLTNGTTYFEANGAPAITSVTASVSGVLAADDDYLIINDVNSQSGYAIVFNTGGTATVATTESITIVYNSPVVVAKTIIHGGGQKNYGSIEGYIATELKDGTDVKVYFYKGQYSGNLNLVTGAVNTPEATVTDITINLKNNTSLAAGKQFFRIEKG